MHGIYIKIITLLSLCLPVELSTEEDPVFRIANGQFAKLGQFPYQVGLRRREMRNLYITFCGGALIRADKVLTAAHCVVEDNKNFCSKACSSVKYQKKRLSSIYVVAATLLSHDTRARSKGSQSRRLSKIIVHEGYDFPDNDVAILLTKKPFSLSSSIGILPLATKRMDYGNVNCIVSGYGMISKTQDSNYLMWAFLQLISARRCERVYNKRMRHFICTSPSNSTAALPGDSGSPLVCSNTTDPADKGKGVIVGVVIGLGDDGSNLCARVTSFKAFIASKAVVTELPFTSMVLFTGLLRFLY